MVLACRINTLSKGHSGISVTTMEKLIEAFNQDILPFIPEKGTLGSNGDFSQVSHLALGLMGEGKIWNFNTKKYVSALIVLKKKYYEPIEF